MTFFKSTLSPKWPNMSQIRFKPFQSARTCPKFLQIFPNRDWPGSGFCPGPGTGPGHLRLRLPGLGLRFYQVDPSYRGRGLGLKMWIPATEAKAGVSKCQTRKPGPGFKKEISSKSKTFQIFIPIYNLMVHLHKWYGLNSELFYSKIYINMIIHKRL